MRDLSKVVKAQAAALQQFSSKLDFSFLREALLARFSQRSLNNDGSRGGGRGPFDWAALGIALSPLSLAPPETCCLLGALEQQVKVRKTIVRRKRGGEVEAEEVRPDSLGAQDNDLDEATNERVATLLRVTDSLSKGEEGGETGCFDVLKLLVDPSSPLQSVENLFDFAFLLKEKRVYVEQGPAEDAQEGGVRGLAVDPKQLEKCEKQQRVLALPMKDLRLLAQLLHGEGTDDAHAHPLHRTDALYDETDPLKQTRLLGPKRKEGGAEGERSVKKGTTEASAPSPSRPSSKKAVAASKGLKRRASGDTDDDVDDEPRKRVTTTSKENRLN